MEKFLFYFCIALLFDSAPAFAARQDPRVMPDTQLLAILHAYKSPIVERICSCELHDSAKPKFTVLQLSVTLKSALVDIIDLGRFVGDAVDDGWRDCQRAKYLEVQCEAVPATVEKDLYWKDVPQSDHP